MVSDAAHEQRWQIFEVIVGIPYLIGIFLHFVFPIAFPSTGLKVIFILVGILFALMGIILVVLTRREFNRFHQPTDPGESRTRVISSGVFSFSRNPLYLGGFLFLLGTALVFRMLWVVIFLLPAFLACQFFLILPEERYLANKFGEEYRRYTKTVCRWFGRKPPRL